jgi:signal transduction histidine kinase
MLKGLDEARLRRLVEAAVIVSGDLDVETILHRVLEAARDITDSKYAALGILDERKRELERFITLGIPDDQRGEIGELPRGRGILGVLIDDPRPLRLHDVGRDPRSFGVPIGHPTMRSFLGVPIVIRGESFGNLYLTEKRSGDFDEADEIAVCRLAEWAAIAIDNARLYQHAERRRVELERAVRSLETTAAIARAVGGETDLARVLELIVKRGRALVDARALVIVLTDNEDCVVAATAGEMRAGVRGTRLAIAGTAAERVMRSRRAERISDVGDRLPGVKAALGLEAETALVAPLVFRARPLGVLFAFDRLIGGPDFTFDDERLLESFAASAATAVATAQTVERARLSQTIEAAEQERRRWARELHDETLQGLGALRLVLSTARSSGSGDRLEAAVDHALEQLDLEIENLRALVTELRPASLDELGLVPALEALVERTTDNEPFDVVARLELRAPPGEGHDRLAPELESTIYRLVQEGLRNVIRHANASAVSIEVVESDGTVQVVVRDDGTGFDPDEPAGGFGLLGMAERTDLVGGTLSVSSQPGGGTTIEADLPARRAESIAAP